MLDWHYEILVQSIAWWEKKGHLSRKSLGISLPQWEHCSCCLMDEGTVTSIRWAISVLFRSSQGGLWLEKGGRTVRATFYWPPTLIRKARRRTAWEGVRRTSAWPAPYPFIFILFSPFQSSPLFCLSLSSNDIRFLYWCPLDQLPQLPVPFCIIAGRNYHSFHTLGSWVSRPTPRTSGTGQH
jgi:hypothetical protein